MRRHATTVERLLERAGTTYAAEAGIRLADTPAPLYRLLVLSVLLSTPINAGMAVAATRELIAGDMGTVGRGFPAVRVRPTWSGMSRR